MLDTALIQQLFAPRASLFFTRGSGLLARAIRWGERDPRKNEEVSWANHVGVVTRSGYITRPPVGQDAQVSEALWKIMHQSWWEAHKGENTDVAIFRRRDMNLLQETDIVRDALTRTGNKYAWWRLLGYLGERFTKIKFSKMFVLKDRNVCSNHVGLAYAAAGITFPEPPGQLDPDEIFDHCIANPVLWEFMGWSIVTGEK